MKKKRTKSQQGRANRRKGGDYERKIARTYRRHSFDCVRGAQHQDGFNNPDLVLKDTNRDYWIECCHLAGGGMVFRKWKQAEEARDKAESNEQAILYPHETVLHLHVDNGPDLVVISLEHWMSLIGYDRS